MGNFISNNREQSVINELRHRLTALENIDQDRDGLVSKEEYAAWGKKQEATLDIFRKQILSVKEKEHSAAIEKLHAEINTLRQINSQLEDRLAHRNVKVEDSRGIESQEKLFGELSRSYIDQEIDRILSNNDVNVSIIPDYYEKKIYRNIFNMLFGLLESVTTSSEIKFLHHKITFNIQPETSSSTSVVDDVTDMDDVFNTRSLEPVVEFLESDMEDANE